MTHIRIMYGRVCWWFTVLLAGLLTATLAAAEIRYSITDLGVLGGGEIRANAIGGVGRVVGGPLGATSGLYGWAWDAGVGRTVLPSLGGAYGSAYGVNLFGVTTGESLLAGGNTRAFVWDDASGISALPTLGGSNSYGRAISDSGVVVGHSNPIGSIAVHGFAWTAVGGMTDLGTLGGTDSWASDVNAGGKVVGTSSRPADNKRRAAGWDSTTGWTELGTPNGYFSIGNAVNASGKAVGFIFNNVSTRAVVWDGTGGRTELGFLGGGSISNALDLSDSGWAVGRARDANDNVRAFVWNATEGMLDLNTLVDPGLGWQLNEASSTSSDGQIVGYGKLGGVTHAFLLTPDNSAPTPEAPTWILLACTGLAALAWSRRRKG